MENVVEFFNQFKQFADAKTAYKSAKKLFADYVNTAPYVMENGKIILASGHDHGYSQVIAACGGYFAVHVACAENACVRWHDFNFKPWHVGIFAMTRHGLTLVGVVSAGSSPDTFTWWANCHGEFYAEIYSIDGYSAPDTDALKYHGSYRDFLSCVDAAAAFLTEDDDY